MKSQVISSKPLIPAKKETCTSEIVLLNSMHTVCVEHQKNSRLVARFVR